MSQGREVRLRTSSDRKTSMRQYDEMRRNARVDKAVILAEMKDGSFQVLGQGMSIQDITAALITAAESLAHFSEQRIAPTLEKHEEPFRRGIHNESPPRPREVTLDGEGNLVPPKGENIISCGECNHPRWYILHHDADDSPARYVCAHCSNEIKVLRVTHTGGNA